MQQKTLTKGEMQVMNILWDMQRGACVADIQRQFPEPQPAYTTIATFLKIMEQKCFVEKRKSGSGKHILWRLREIARVFLCRGGRADTGGCQRDSCHT